MNNDFFVTREVICQWFSNVTSSLVQIIGKSTRDRKIVIHGNQYIILYDLHNQSLFSRIILVLTRWGLNCSSGYMIFAIGHLCIRYAAHWDNIAKLYRHDDVIKWKHFPRYWPFVRGIHRSPVNSPHTGQWRGSLMFSLICVWIYGWVNNGEAGDLRYYRAHFDATVMVYGQQTLYLVPLDTFMRVEMVLCFDISHSAKIGLINQIRISILVVLNSLHWCISGRLI